MPLSKTDRITFSGKIASSSGEIKALDAAAKQVSDSITEMQKLDDANARLAAPTETLIAGYQLEFGNIDGNIRSTFTEQDVNNAAVKKVGNYFFPNNLQLSVPSLSGKQNIWAQTKPFVLAFGVGKNYDQSYTSGPSESHLIADALALITQAQGQTDIINTTGESCNGGGTCSLNSFTTESTCSTGGGIWTAADVIAADAPTQTLKGNLVTKIQGVVTQLTAELSHIVTADPDATNTANNSAATNNINNVILPALNAWLAYADFNTAHGQTTCASFNSYDSSLLAPTKLHSVQLSALQTALQARQTFLTTRVAQLNAVLGTVTQDIETGAATGSGLYFKRFQFLNLRINTLTGSLTDLTGAQGASTAQAAIKQDKVDANTLYLSIVPTSTAQASATGSAILPLNSPDLFNVGDTVFVISDTQDELLRAVKAKNGSMITLNDVVPQKYQIGDNLRVYKDLT